MGCLPAILRLSSSTPLNGFRFSAFGTFHSYLTYIPKFTKTYQTIIPSLQLLMVFTFKNYLEGKAAAQEWPLQKVHSLTPLWRRFNLYSHNPLDYPSNYLDCISYRSLGITHGSQVLSSIRCCFNQKKSATEAYIARTLKDLC